MNAWLPAAARGLPDCRQRNTVRRGTGVCACRSLQLQSTHRVHCDVCLPVVWAAARRGQHRLDGGQGWEGRNEEVHISELGHHWRACTDHHASVMP